MSNSKKRSEEQTHNRTEIGVDKDQAKEDASDQLTNSETAKEQKETDRRKSPGHQTPDNTRPMGMDA